jgi:hypothetical protein
MTEIMLNLTLREAIALSTVVEEGALAMNDAPEALFFPQDTLLHSSPVKDTSVAAQVAAATRAIKKLDRAIFCNNPIEYSLDKLTKEEAKEGK